MTRRIIQYPHAPVEEIIQAPVVQPPGERVSRFGVPQFGDYAQQASDPHPDTPVCLWDNFFKDGPKRPITLLSWVKKGTAVTTYQPVFSVRHSTRTSPYGFTLYGHGQTTNTPGLQWRTGGLNFANSDESFLYDDWQLVVGVADSTGFHLYHNGTFRASGATATETPSAWVDVGLFTATDNPDQASPQGWTQSIGSSAIVARAMSAAEIKAIFDRRLSALAYAKNALLFGLDGASLKEVRTGKLPSLYRNIKTIRSGSVA